MALAGATLALLVAGVARAEANATLTASQDGVEQHVTYTGDASRDAVSFEEFFNGEGRTTTRVTRLAGGANITPGGQCTTEIPDHVWMCVGAGDAVSYKIQTRGGDDRLEFSERGFLSHDIDLGSGDDEVVGARDTVSGGTGDDSITGSTNFSMKASGGAGDDRLVAEAAGNLLDAGPGQDTVLGSGGADTIQARDGERDTVDCDGGTDHAVADGADAVSHCEIVDVDDDKDGYEPPRDCDDHNASVHPDTADIPDNGLDDDCVGGDTQNLDRDGDGFNRPADCNDADAAIKPSAIDRPGNGMDENCDGRDAAYSRVASSVTTLWNLNKRTKRTRLIKLIVIDAPFASTVEIRCRGRGCAGFKRKRVRSPGVRFLRLTRVLAHRRLHAAAVIEVRITAPDTVGKAIRFRIRARRLPRSTTRCVVPNGTQAKPCGQVG